MKNLLPLLPLDNQELCSTEQLV